MKTFFDRYDAGSQLAQKLDIYKDADSIVLALPRGGVPVGCQIATALNFPLDMVIARKIGHPFNKELAICAVAEDGTRVCNDYGLWGIDKEWVLHETEIAVDEAARRRRVYGGSSTQPLEGKVVIVTDDGVATGLTMKAALLMIRPQKPKKIVLAVPVCPYEVLKELRTEVDEVVVLDESRDYRGSVGAYYAHFPQVSDKEVVKCLKDAKTVKKAADLVHL